MARVLKCPQCQAPLKWKGLAAVVECCYCNSNVLTGQKVPGQDIPEHLKGTRTDLPAQIVTIDAAQSRRGILGASMAALVFVGIGTVAFLYLQEFNAKTRTSASSPPPSSTGQTQTTSRRVASQPATQTPKQASPSTDPAEPSNKASTDMSAPSKALATTKPRLRSGQLFAVRPNQGLRKYAEALGLKTRRGATVLEVSLSDRPFKSATVSWLKRAKTAHALTLRLTARDAAMEQRLRDALGPRLKRTPAGGMELSLAGTTVSVSADGRVFDVRVLAATDPDWETRFMALWLITGQVATGSLPIMDQDARELVYRGYAIRDMVAFELSAFTQGALDSKVRPPGIVRLDSSRFLVPLDRGWFSQATLHYAKRRDERLTSVTLEPWERPPGQGGLEPAARAALAPSVVAQLMACITTTLGVPETFRPASAPPGHKRVGFRWTPAGLVSVELSRGGLRVAVEDPGDSPPVATQKTWNALWLAVAKCSGEKLE